MPTAAYVEVVHKEDSQYFRAALFKTYLLLLLQEEMKILEIGVQHWHPLKVKLLCALFILV
jgi:hypothetical protein